MNSIRAIWFAIAILGICGVWSCASRLRAEADKPGRPKSNLAQAADAALKATEAQYAFQQASVEDVYLWSRRLMEAEMQEGAGNKAIADHVARMQNLHAKVAALFKAGVVGGSEDRFYATAYYLEEAKLMQKPVAE
jgi:hypothetical protein